ncbi:hypothetical protein [Methanosarcina sp. UBA411]|jgi:hypothetical protein|uniref:hypothetical protein n=1 Tax=Methanosarcina sp. UBA411 TaxID=1915589 RepID=UPI0025DD5974|nr:hypothetical protein [Methanosarcina sp. UBA411]
MKVGERKQQGHGKAQKTICPKCGEEYLETAGGKKGNSWKKIGLYCPNPSCDYIVKDPVKLEEETESMNELEND